MHMPLPFSICLSLALAFSGPTGCSATPDEPDAINTRIGELTGARTRVVWVQDHQALTDVFAEGNQLRLMGRDSLDPHGERVILPGPANFFKPMITRRGDRIVYTDKPANRIFIVNWDGTGHRDLIDGVALAVWIDPGTDEEWMYVAREPVDAKGLAFRVIDRHPIDDLSRSERVWDRTQAGIDNVQLSADGARASGVFPWPECGVIRIVEQTFHRHGRGCWPSYAPDNSYRFWFFDGSHRNLTLVDERSGQRTEIDINTAPGMDGYEVYHPRWSNHPRFMTLTGPYKIRQGGNNIRGGGPDVEVFIGRFNETFTAIEAWAKVTENAVLDVGPDVWVELPARPAANDPPPAQAAPDATGAAWPVSRDGLVYVWENRGAKNEIVDAAGKFLRLCSAEPRGQARFGRHLDMDARGGFFVADEIDADLFAASALTIEMTITPSGASADPTAVFTYGNNLSLLVAQGSWILASAGTNPAQHTLSPVAAMTTPTHIVLSIREGVVRFYIDGRRESESPLPENFFSGWSTGPLFFGARAGGVDPWSGFIEGVAMYNRGLTEEDVRDAYTHRNNLVTQRVPAPRLHVKARLVAASHIPTPGDIAPYRRALVVNEYDVVDLIAGAMEDRRFLAAHWAILDGEILPHAARAVGQVYEMTLEPYEERRELEGERLAMDSDNLLLRTFFDTEFEHR
jgi:hypothetical protein